MKILFVHHVADLYGSSQSLLRLSRAWMREGHQVCVALQEDGPLRDALTAAGAKVRLLSGMPVLHRNRLTSLSGIAGLIRQAWKSGPAFAALLRDERPDAVHVNTATILPVAGREARRLGIPFVQHYRESFHDFGCLWPVYRAWILRYATRVISISDYLAGQFTPTQRERFVRVARNGIPLDEFTPPDPSAVRTFRDTWGLRSPVITLVGRIKLKRKGQEVFLQAAAELRKRHPEATFVIAGAPFPGNESHLHILQCMVSDLGLDGSVVFTGHIQDVRIVLANSDISVMASSTPEPLGNVTMESMAMGVPVVGTSIGGTPELMQDGVTGLVVPPANPSAMAAAMAKLLDDPGFARRLAEAGRRHFVEDLSFEPFFTRIQSIYREILPEHSP